MRKTALRAAFVVVALGGLVALPLAFASGEESGPRQDCPGKVVCPLTGEEVCKDECPVGATAAKATVSTMEAADELPPCCRNLKK